MIDLKNTRILVANDDGIDAEGIKVLERIARTLSDDVWVVAPQEEQSGAGHSLTLHEPIRIHQRAERHFCVRGTPTDTVLMAVMEILTDKRPGLILSGINRGPNLAEDATYSGTIAAAMEGTLLEIPSIALSNFLPPEGAADYRAAEAFAPDIIRSVCAVEWPPHTLINLNFPGLAPEQVKGVQPCHLGRRRVDPSKIDRRTDPRGRPYYWIAGPGNEPFSEEPTADYHQLAAGYITVTPLDLDMTDYPFLEKLRGIFARENAA